MERAGAERARAFKGNILGTELGMNMQMLAGAEAARNQAITNVAGGAGNLVAGGVGMYQNSIDNTIDMGDGVEFLQDPNPQIRSNFLNQTQSNLPGFSITPDYNEQLDYYNQYFTPGYRQ